MSVAVLIDYVDAAAAAASGARDYLPVATEGVYSKYWLPAARKLGCTWLPWFQTGAPVPLESLPAVIDEFRRVRDYFQRDPTSPVAERSRWLVDELERLDLSTVAELFIG
jgi:hypothetical protein